MSRDSRYQDSSQDSSYDASSKSAEEIQADIEKTRSRISEEVDAIGHRFSPAGLSEDAKEVLHSTQGASFQALDELGKGLTERSGQLKGGVVGFFKRNPAPTTLLGLGFVWLLMRSSRTDRRRTRDHR